MVDVIAGTILYLAHNRNPYNSTKGIKRTAANGTDNVRNHDSLRDPGISDERNEDRCLRSPWYAPDSHRVR